MVSSDLELSFQIWYAFVLKLKEEINIKCVCVDYVLNNRQREASEGSSWLFKFFMLNPNVWTSKAAAAKEFQMPSNAISDMMTLGFEWDVQRCFLWSSTSQKRQCIIQNYKWSGTDVKPFAGNRLRNLRRVVSSCTPLFAATVLQLRVLRGLLMLKTISHHLDKVNVCLDFANGGV